MSNLNEDLFFNEYEDVESYGKLEGPNIKHFIHKTNVCLGRKTDEITWLDPDEQMVYIGDSQKISRRHAKIFWNSKQRQWQIQSLSKNKIYVNGVVIRREDPPLHLTPSSALKIESYKFYFFPAIKIDSPNHLNIK